MKTYEVGYLEGSEKKTAFVTGGNEAEAGKKFSSMHPGVSANEILTVKDIEAGNSVVVTDIQMPFISMVIFMVKWAIASIPALLILALIFTVVAGMFGNLLR